MEYIPRLAETRIRASLDKKSVLMLLGPRQAGKTTLAKRLLTQYGGEYLNLDVAIDHRQFLRFAGLDPKRLTDSLKPGKLLIIDEAQKLPETGRIVKGWYDSDVPRKILLLGSSSLDLLDRTAEPLTGRNEKVYLLPLSWDELLPRQSWFRKGLPASIDLVRPILEEAVVYGGYPAVYTTDEREMYLETVTSDYLLKDVMTPGLIRDAGVVKKLLLLLAYQIGQEVSVLELSRSLGIARMTVERYLGILERCFIIFSLPAYSTNPRKEILKSKKIYFWDTGIRNALIDQLGELERPDIGVLWENWVVAECAKRTLGPLGVPLSFWRTRDGSEVDLLWKHRGELSAYEIKWNDAARVRKQSFERRYGTAVHLITPSSVTNILEKISRT